MFTVCMVHSVQTQLQRIASDRSKSKQYNPKADIRQKCSWKRTMLMLYSEDEFVI